MTYTLYAPSIRSAFGCTEWDHNLIDAASYGSRELDGRIVTSFTLQQLIAWFDNGSDDPQRNVRKAFYDTVRRHLKRGSFLVPLDYRWHPDPDVADEKSVYEAAKIDDWCFRFGITADPNFPRVRKPRGYLEHRWSRVISKQGRGILNLLLALDAGSRPVRVPKIIEHYRKHVHMHHRQASKGIRDLEALGIITIAGETLTASFDPLDGPPPVPAAHPPRETPETTQRLLAGKDAAIVSQFEEALIRLNALDEYRRWLPGLKRAFSDMNTWHTKPRYPHLLKACEIVARMPVADRKWQRAIAQATAMHKRHRASASAFTKRINATGRETVSTYPCDPRAVQFERAEAVVFLERESLESPAELTVDVFDGHSRPLASERVVIEPGHKRKVLCRLDLTTGLKRYAEAMVPGEEPALELGAWTNPRDLHVVLCITVELDGVSPR